MTDDASTASPPAAIPPDDPGRRLVVADPDSPALPHVSVAGDTYTVLVSGKDSGGRYCLIDMHVPPGGGPPPHRHDFEEMFTVLDGEVEVTFRGETITARQGETVNVPANAPHAFTNAGDTPSRLLCLCAPAGQEEFFTLVGRPVATRTEAPAPLGPDEQAAFVEKSRTLAPQYRTELLPPPAPPSGPGSTACPSDGSSRRWCSPRCPPRAPRRATWTRGPTWRRCAGAPTRTRGPDAAVACGRGPPGINLGR